MLREHEGKRLAVPRFQRADHPVVPAAHLRDVGVARHAAREPAGERLEHRQHVEHAAHVLRGELAHDRAATSSISPSLARNLSASRSGVRDTPSCWQSCPSCTRAPGAGVPSMIMSRTRLTPSSCRLRRAIGAGPSVGWRSENEDSMIVA
jgi:hypothetical protein